MAVTQEESRKHEKESNVPVWESAWKSKTSTQLLKLEPPLEIALVSLETSKGSGVCLGPEGAGICLGRGGAAV
ncbi:mCG147003 [Mus musculus]|jgi:hypothetical protein|nr:mCG147003 [Mus musculus]